MADRTCSANGGHRINAYRLPIRGSQKKYAPHSLPTGGTTPEWQTFNNFATRARIIKTGAQAKCTPSENDLNIFIKKSVWGNQSESKRKSTAGYVRVRSKQFRATAGEKRNTLNYFFNQSASARRPFASAGKCFIA